MGSTSGVFPVPPGDAAGPYAGDAAAVRAQSFIGTIARRPHAGRPHCLSPRRAVGVALNGVPILPPFTRSGRDAVVREVNDSCGGRTNSAGRYYYRSGLSCLLPSGHRRMHSPRVGWARDGFSIFGPRGAGGRRLHGRDLDACHGHTHRVRIGGRSRTVYHYHLTADFPYTVGCFRGVPSRDWRTTGLGDLETVPAPSPALPDERDDVQVTTTPALRPGFDPRAGDYVVACTDAEPVQITADAPGGVQLSVDGRPAQTGHQTQSVSVGPSQAFRLAVTSRLGTREYSVRCLPADFPAYTSQRTGAPQAQWYVVTPTPDDGAGYVAVFDAWGVPVWWMFSSAPRPIDAKLLANHEIVWSEPSHTPFEFPYVFHRLDGTVTRTLATVGTLTDLHDLQPLPNGNYLLGAYDTRDHVDLSPYGGPSDASVLDAIVQELTPDGELVWSWNSKDHIALAETGRWFDAQVIDQPRVMPDGSSAYDIVHMNSFTPDGDGMLVSLRHTDAVYRIRRSDGAIDWKLGGTARPESLTVMNDPHAAQPLGGPHDARIPIPGSLSVHDNGTGLARAPRALRYRIDPLLRTATLEEELVDPRAPSSFCCGSARRLSGGNWVAAWGSRPFFTELAPDGAPALTVTFEGGEFSYRAAPVEPGAVEASALRAGMDAMHPR